MRVMKLNIDLDFKLNSTTEKDAGNGFDWAAHG